MTAGPLITTPRNRRVTGARRLVKRAFRRSERRFLVEGPKGVAEALREPGALHELFVTPEASERHADLVDAAAAAGVPTHTVTGDVLAAVAQTVTPQGVLGVAAFRDVELAAVLALRPRLVAVLANVRDPGNAGTILRVADAAGVEAVVFAADSVDPYNPKCVRASAGSIFHVPFAIAGDIATVAGVLRDSGVRVLAADAAAPTDIDHADLGGATAWVFGNEAWGLDPAALACADVVVRVPIHGRAESLNLATAAAVCLYASARAQREPGGCRT